MRKTMATMFMALAVGCAAPAANAGPTVTPSTNTTSPLAPRPSSTARAGDEVIYWALDRGPVGSPDSQRLVYLFGVGDHRGPAKLLARDGSVVGEAGVMGSGIFDPSSCLSRVGSKQTGVVVIGPVVMTAAAQAAFLADPTAYRADVDVGSITPGAGRVLLRLEDTGCRPI